ncbi:MAG: AAA family ATPase [Leptodesmis sp.]|uniref:AAA family ATPase n=1 Tax=Leptodesmis sp. TaxID=3100501 RepID=UPI003D0E118F
MEILSVTLKNFKSHSDRHFVFQPGTNAICGENGAGKTSILEAIAWVLFDYSGDYTKEDLIRNGSGSAQVQIAFVSNRDGRTYEVHRCTTKSYTLYDPQLKERLPYNRIKEEVLPWLRQHLGVSPGTDLSQLFSSTIGVPQGTFAADFLLTKERRKAIFDKILKVEEYQHTWKKLADLEKYAKTQVEDLEKEIARYQADLQELEGVHQKHLEQRQEIEQVQANLQQAQQRLADLQRERDELSSLAARLQQLDLHLTQLQPRLQSQAKHLERLQKDLETAEAAAAICTKNRESYQIVQQADTTLRELEQQRSLAESLQRQQRQQEERLSDRHQERTKLTLQLNRLTEAAQEIQHLEPLAQRQMQLETIQQTVSQQLQSFTILRQTLQEREKRLNQLQVRHAQVGQQIQELQALQPAIAEIPDLEQQQHRYQEQLSRIAAATQFETDLRHLWQQSQTEGDRFLAQTQQAKKTIKELQKAVPSWSSALAEILTVLESGQSWQKQMHAALDEILADLTAQTSPETLTHHLQQVQTRLQTARQYQTRYANLDRWLTNQSQLETEMAELQSSLTQLQTQLAEEPVLQDKYAQLAEELTHLDNPRGRLRLRQEELHQEAALKAQMMEVWAACSEIEQAIAQLNQQLSEFGHLSEQIQTQQALRAAHREAYEIYVKNREVANSRKQKHQQVQDAIAELQALEQQQQDLSAERDRLRQTFDPDYFQTVQQAYQETKDKTIALSARLPDMLKYLEELEQQLLRLAALQAKLTEAQTQLEQKRKTERFIKFARKAYKEAGPRITERYIQTISREADKLFRELLNRSNVSLQWTRDYEILIQESAHQRRFVNLSGGEQMCAALAVRLALLKVLADIDIAFFDEPTTNMDRARREHLAEAIANIKTFRQLFVISHDDTFEKITENIIVVEREG